MTLKFRQGLVHENGRLSLPLVTISFDAPLSLIDFVTTIGGIDNFDLETLALKNISLLADLLGGEDHLKFLEETPASPPPSPPSAMTLSVDSQTVDEDRDAVKLADITFINGSGPITASLTEASDLFEIKNGDELWLKPGKVLDYETANLHRVTVQVEQAPSLQKHSP